MKRTVYFLLAILMLALPMTAALGEDVSLAAAQDYVGKDAKLIERELERGFEELEFRDDAYTYEVLVDARSGIVRQVETKSLTLRPSARCELTEEAACDALHLLQPDAVVHYALLEKDDGCYSWQLFAVLNNDLVQYTLSAENGDLLEINLFPGAAEGSTTADELVQALTDAMGAFDLTALEMEWDSDLDALIYSGDATLDGVRYEFESHAEQATLVEWKRD